MTQPHTYVYTHAHTQHTSCPSSSFWAESIKLCAHVHIYTPTLTKPHTHTYRYTLHHKCTHMHIHPHTTPSLCPPNFRSWLEGCTQDHTDTETHEIVYLRHARTYICTRTHARTTCTCGLTQAEQPPLNHLCVAVNALRILILAGAKNDWISYVGRAKKLGDRRALSLQGTVIEQRSRKAAHRPLVSSGGHPLRLHMYTSIVRSVTSSRVIHAIARSSI